MASQLKANFKRYVEPRSVVSIDEIMLRFTGRSLHTVVLRGRPVPLGYGILALCDAGYVYGFLFDSLKAPFEGNVLIRNEAFDRFDWQTLDPDVQLAIDNCRQLRAQCSVFVSSSQRIHFSSCLWTIT